MEREPQSLGDLLDDLEASGREEAVSIGEVVERFQRRSLGVLLAVFGLATVAPIIGDIPGMAILCATLSLLAIGQSAGGGGSLRLPRFVRRREIGRERFRRGIDAARPWARRADRLFGPRLGRLSRGRAGRLGVSLSAAVLALALYPLAFVPFGANAPGLGLLALGLGLMFGDGALVLIGHALAAVTIIVLVVSL